MNQIRSLLLGAVLGGGLVLSAVPFWPELRTFLHLNQKQETSSLGQPGAHTCLHEPNIEVSYPKRDGLSDNAEAEPESTIFTVKNGAETLETFTLAGARTAEITKQAGCVVYFRASTTGLGGYILYGALQDPWYRVDLSERSVAQLPVPDYFALEDISPDESMLVASDRERHAVVLLDSKGKELKRFPVDSAYEQFGDILFSPNGKKIAYAAAVGNPDEERGNVFVVNLGTGETTDQVGKLNGYFTLNPWRDNQSPMYLEH